MNLPIFYDHPLWLILAFCVVVLGLAVELGFRIGYWKHRALADGEAGGGGVVLSSMLALLGLILAFTYSASSSRLDARKLAVVEEANALGTAFLRAGLVAEPGRSELRVALYDYARTRVGESDVLFDDHQRREKLARTLRAQAELWPITERIVQASGRGAIEASLVGAVNEVIDIHTVRVMAGIDRLPVPVVWMLLGIASAAMAITGFQAGISGHISRWRVTLFSLVLALVMVLILDLDRPRDGLIQVRLAPLNSLILDMALALEADAAAETGVGTAN